jgi:hypothetical protein
LGQPPHARRFCNLDSRVFVIGVGAQKAGTTWLYDYLGRHPQVAMSPIKELHYFDVVHRPDLCAFFSEDFRRDLQQLLHRMASGQTASLLQLQCLADRVRMDSDAYAYLEYFDRLATHGRRVTGEITPSYSLLPQAGFAAMRDMIASSGAKPRIVFVMRDPVERFWSQCRMQSGFQTETRSVEQICDSAMQDPGFLERTRYDWTISKLENSFPPSELLLLFFEKMFSEEGARQICDFLEIGYVPPDAAQRVNALPPAVLDAARRRRLREVLLPVYRFVDARFGESVPPAWRSTP